MRIDTFEFSSKGGRERNEVAVSLRIVEDKGIFVVADGLGGHKDGNLASQKSVAFLCESWSLLEGQAFSREWMEAAIRKTNQGLLMMQEERRSNMRSTLAMLLKLHITA